MKILISNDDGLYGAGLQPLVDAMKELGEVFVIVPDSNRSASSHSITIYKPLQFFKKKKNVYTLSGTPSDCVRFGLLGILKNEKIDFVISGINDGANMGDDCIYSGTVAAAREGAIMGYPSFSSSLVPGKRQDFKRAAKYTSEIIKKTLKFKMPEHTFLNINVPDSSTINGIELTKMGKRIYNDYIKKRKDSRGRNFYWIESERISGQPIKNSDIVVLGKNKVSVTPLKINQTDESYYQKLKKFKF